MAKAPTRELLRFRYFLNELMRENQWSEQAAGANFGVSQATINNILNDNQVSLSSDYIRIAVDKFGVDPWYFFDDYDQLCSYHDYPKERSRVRTISKQKT